MESTKLRLCATETSHLKQKRQNIKAFAAFLLCKTHHIRKGSWRKDLLPVQTTQIWYRLHFGWQYECPHQLNPHMDLLPAQRGAGIY